MVHCCLEKLRVRTISLLCSFSWLHWLLSNKRAKNLFVGTAKFIESKDNYGGVGRGSVRGFMSRLFEIRCQLPERIRRWAEVICVVIITTQISITLLGRRVLYG